MRYRIVVVAAAVMSLQNVGRSSSDSCAQLIPDSLRRAAETQFSDFRIPQESDNDSEGAAYSKKHGGSTCLGGAVGRYYGKRTKDYALLLTSASNHVLLVVATRAGASWQMEVVRDWHDAAGERRRMYADTIAKGQHQRTAAGDGGTLETGEVPSYTSKYPGVISGTLEGGAVAYFFTGIRWVHVWISD
jgi:hypothetical protein